jgi:hypothetical protein
VRDRHIFQLKIAYGFLLGLYVILAFLWKSVAAEVRTILLLLALVAVVSVHIRVARHSQASNSNRLFFLFTVSWCLELVAFLADEGLGLFKGESPLSLSFFTFLLLIMLLTITALSFVFRKPFLYNRVESKGYVAVGLVALVVCGWLVVMSILGLADHLRLGIEAKCPISTKEPR